ncbi:MAG: hypothetical protein SFW65_07965 [Alphaproteobacteria bacterium]|nr:hypothetical protein [Alphaproteobacteria bacterium]
MSTYANRGARAGWSSFNPVTFWTNQIFGHQIDGVWTPSLNVSVSDMGGFPEVTFSYVGDAGDEGGPYVPAKEQFITFMSNPKVAEQALDLIGQHLGWKAKHYIRLFIDLETTALPPRPQSRETGIEKLRAIAKGTPPNP